MNIILLELISQARSGTAEFPEKLIVHKHLKSIDFPRDLEGNQSALIHPSLKSANWSLINQGQPIFQFADDNVIELFDKELPDQVVPVFINEAAYMEKGIAMSFTVKENLVIQDQWKNHLYKFLIGNQI